MKIVRRVCAGVHPESEMTRYLTERGFGNSAPLYGELVRVDPDGTPNTFGLVQGFVRNQGDGWTWTLDFLARSVEEVAQTGTDQGDEVSDVFVSYDVFAAAIGKRLGELHAILASPTDQPDFAPEEVDEAGAASWAEGAIEQIDGAFGLLRATQEWPDEATADLAKWVLDQEIRLKDAAYGLARAGAGSLCTRVHGDFHLGQVLVVQGDAFIIDFEGEPARPMEQRRQKGSPLRDVAGLLRSFDYAAAAAAPGRIPASPQVGERRAALLEHFRHASESAFLNAYRAVLHEANPRWVKPSAEAALLDLFLIEKAAYEIRYEAANRPTWLGIPLQGLQRIVERVLQPAEGSAE
jgi:maltose alpha-D-glucosyltransferase/alpha-amylase